jgi:hypothetical protein
MPQLIRHSLSDQLTPTDESQLKRICAMNLDEIEAQAKIREAQGPRERPGQFIAPEPLLHETIDVRLGPSPDSDRCKVPFRGALQALV